MISISKLGKSFGGRVLFDDFGAALNPVTHVGHDAWRINPDHTTIRVGDLTASQDVVTVTRRGGFLSAASQRLLEIIRAGYARTTPAGRAAGRPKRTRSNRRRK